LRRSRYLTTSYFIAYKKGSKELLGYTFTAGKTGYSSKVLTMAGLDPQFNIINIKVIDQAETPGLGANCTAPSFSDQFKGKTQEDMLVDKDGGPIKSLCGATITTRAKANSLLKEQILVLRAHVELAGNKSSDQAKQEVSQ
jgi:electron transport complex protein RnfG